MRLNPDCIRDILVTVEENTGFYDFMEYPPESAEDYPKLAKYTEEEVFYHIKQCYLSGLLTELSWTLEPTCSIHDLTPAGHEFMANIRSDTNWAKTKEVAGKIGSLSLQVLTKVAAEIVTSLIKNHL
jgi:hypothetical protein